MIYEKTFNDLRNHNIDLAKACNIQKMHVNRLCDDLLDVQHSLFNAQRRRAELESQLDKKTLLIEELQRELIARDAKLALLQQDAAKGENDTKMQLIEQLRKELIARDDKLVFWRTKIIDLFKTNATHMVEVMQLVGITPSQNKGAPQAEIVSKSEAPKNVRESEEIVNASNKIVSPFSVKREEWSLGPFSSSANITFRSLRKPKSDESDDLIRFSKTPNLTAKQKNQSSADKDKSKAMPSEEDFNLYSQLNESLDLLNNYAQSTLYPNVEISSSSTNDDEFSDDSLSDSLWSMKIDYKGVSESQPIKVSENGEQNGKMFQQDAGNKENEVEMKALAPSSPLITVTTIKRKLDPHFLRVPKTSDQHSTQGTPKKSKPSEPLAFITKSPRLSSKGRDSSSPIKPSGALKHRPTILNKIDEKFPVKSPLMGSANNHNIQRSPHPNKKHQSKSASDISGKKMGIKSKVIKTKLGDHPLKQLTGQILTEDIDTSAVYCGRPSRRAAPTDLREPLLKFKMRR